MASPCIEDAIQRNSLLGVPVELLTSIIEQLTSVADLKAVWLICKALQNTALPLLYHTINLVPAQLRTGLADTFHPSDKALGHIRHVKLAMKMVEGLYQKEINSAFCHLLIILPQDSLDTLDLCTLWRLPDNVLRLICARQRKLKNWQLYEQRNSPIDQLLESGDRMECITRIDLLVHSKFNAEIGSKVLTRAKRLVELKILVGMHVNMGIGGQRHVQHTEFLRVLFPGLQREPIVPAPKLRRLYLVGVDLWSGGLPLLNSLDLSELEQLDLDDCCNTYAFLAALAERHHNLRSIQLQRAVDIRPSESGTYIDGLSRLLQSAERLETLRVSYQVDNGEAFAALVQQDHIIRCGATLRSLYLKPHYGGQFALRHGLHSWKNLVDIHEALHVLEELAITPPPGIEVSWPVDQHIVKFLDSLGHLKALRTLRFLVKYPSHHPIAGGRPYAPQPPEVIEREMHTLANTVFGTISSKCTRLRGLMLTVWTIEGGCGNFRQLGNFAFLRSEPKEYGPVAGVPVPAHMLKHHVSPSGVLVESPNVVSTMPDD